MTEEKLQKLRILFDSFSYPEDQWLSADELGVTDEEFREYQIQKEQEVSMKPGEKRNLIVKEVVKPLLKNAGFRCRGANWWKELEDGWMFIHMKNSRFNGGSTGCDFEFLFSVSKKDEIQDKFENQWIYNQIQSLNQLVFLPYCGYMLSHVQATGYRIDGYRNYLPIDEPVENLMAQIRNDFENYVIPAISKVRNKIEWQELREEMIKRYDEKDVRLLRYYAIAQECSCSSENLVHIIEMQKSLGLTAKDITSHFDWLKIQADKSGFPSRDAKPFILQALTMQ